MATDVEVHSVEATTHGRVLVRRARAEPVRGVLAGFHGYMETAATQLARLEMMAGSSAWTLVSVQALHRFYRGRSQEIAASWMTREDRDAAIADNLAYVAAALRIVSGVTASCVVYVGYSQGVAMAFRAAVRNVPTAAGVIAVGGDVPPELLADPTVTFPPVFLSRGGADEWYSAEKQAADVSALTAHGTRVDPFVYDAGHEWTSEVAAAAARWLETI
jgi:predicted esterase